ncbi:CaiB/BaiF CoA transferase family protein [Steroidobacter sp.]|uniref:CaiB/BaiF CoA transferase family protein n=1 Tax=Steroidobacter sp. TaxID=1978227 RepID=UPI001A4B419F|nr:CaiB/BaiF CoA-transferase family protein [Steroidobacter sp.]MBL8270334.1 CoA transferase [Steroidobacter sp.]
MSPSSSRGGPLSGVRIVEVAGLGPGPFCGMMLADMGADVITIERSTASDTRHEPINRNRTRLALDLKSDEGRQALLQLVTQADVLFEGYRPGVAERLGFGPDVCLELNPKLVYGRMTGWGQTGPLANAAGHDINYISLAGALHGIGRSGEKPVPPLNLVGDFGGGGMMLAFGIVCALLEAQRSGQGQVVDAAMVDGSVALMAMSIGFKAGGTHPDGVGASLLSGGAHYYDTYETSDGKFISIGSLEPQFFALLMDKLDLKGSDIAQTGMTGPQGFDANVWKEMKPRLAAIFRTRSRDEWCALLEGTDVCFAPVLSLSEAPFHPHNLARQAFVDVGGQLQNAPAPRFSRTPPAQPSPAEQGSTAVAALLNRWGIAALKSGI